MKKTALLLAVLLVLLCFAACRDKDGNSSDLVSTPQPDVSSGFEIVITDDKDPASSESQGSNVTDSSDLQQAADDWDNMEVEIQVGNPSSNVATSSKDATTSSRKTSSNVSSKPVLSSSQKESGSSKTEQSSSAPSQNTSVESTSSKVTSLPDYYEGRY